MHSDAQPRYPTGRVRMRHGLPYCDDCGRRIADSRQHRCPWVSCHVWFRGSATPPPVSQRQRDRAARAQN